jgi:hypothetical protein
MTLLDVVLRLAEGIADELQGRGLVEIFDGENRLKNLLQTHVLALCRSDVLLQKKIVRVLLDFY